MIRSDHHGRVAAITIDRPERRNAVDLDHVVGMQAAVDKALADSAVRVIVLAGAHGNFCSGADLTTVEDGDFLTALTRLFDTLGQCPVSTMAAIEGVALGAGTQFAISCDLRVAAPDAAIGIPAAKLGLMVHQWTVHRLADLAGQSTARAMLLAGELLSGRRAHEIGFVQRIGSVDDALDWADYVGDLAPLTVQGHKLGLNQAEHEPPPTPEYEEALRRAWASADLREGLDAYRSKRKPDFAGE